MTADAYELPTTRNSQFSSQRWQVIPETTVVTQNSDGSPASLFQEDSWKIDSYGANVSNRNLHFRNLTADNSDSLLNSASKSQTKQVMYFLMHMCSDDVPAPLSLKSKLTSLRKFCKFASTKKKTLYEAFEDSKTILSYIMQAGFEAESQRLHAIFVQLHQLGRVKTGVDIPFRLLHSPMLKRFRERQEASQHPVIPTRIYQHFLAQCENELCLVEAAADDLVHVIRCVYGDKPLPATASPALEASLTYFGRTLVATSISALVTEIALLCQVLIMAFTGMRVQEARNLPFQCLTKFIMDGIEHYAIEGVTTKLTGGRVKRACWVTSSLGFRAVMLAQKLLGEAHAQFGKPDYMTSTDGTHRLFSKIGICAESYETGRGIGNNSSYVAAFRQRAFVRITLDDVAELKLIDPFRSWEHEPEFAVGEIWPFTRHQLRRTLALYAQRSGLVTLPSLKRQLHHITAEMSMYYARGSAFAKDLLATNKKHFAKEWQETQGMSQYLAYAVQVLLSDERLFGGHSAWAKSRAVKQSPVSVYSRLETLQMFERGQLAYKETVLGGCTSTKECDSSPLEWLNLKCLVSNCKNQVLVLAKLQRVIKVQEKAVEGLGTRCPGSVEYRMEKYTLATLRAAEVKLRASEEG